MRTITDSVYQPPTPANQGYSASVPLSVYRQLAAELQAAETAIHQLNLKNEHLAQENYILRQEIAKTVNSVLQLQNAVNSSVHTTNYQKKPVERSEKQYPRPQKRQNVPPRRAKRSRKPPVAHQVTEFIEPLPEPVFIEEQQASYYYTDESEISQVSGWWLIFAIISIIVMGFGAGYVVVRPILENNTR